MKKIVIAYQDTLPRPNTPIDSIQDGIEHARYHLLSLMGKVAHIANSLTLAGHDCFIERVSSHEVTARGVTSRVPNQSFEGSDRCDVVILLRDLDIGEFDHLLEFSVVEAGALLVVVDPLAKVSESGFRDNERVAWCREVESVPAALTALLKKGEQKS